MNKNQPFPTVIKVLDKYNIVINKGSEHGIRKHQEFLIYNLSEEDIIDPVTKDNLGKLEIVRGEALVVHVQDKMATLTSSDYKENKIYNTKPWHPLADTQVKETTTQVPFKNVAVGDYAKPL